MIKNKWLYIVIITILFLSAWYVIATNIFSEKWKIIENQNHTKQKKVYNHIFAERISKNDFFTAEFIANDIASIYPRRDAIVRDILVDIWDNVEPWDTLAVLFNPWVQGEAQSQINIKNTIVDAKNKQLGNLIEVKNAKIEEINQKISEKKLVLEETIRNYDTKIYQIWDISTQAWEYQVTLRSLENLEKNLENAQVTQSKLLQESKNNIQQKQQLLRLKIDEIYNQIIPILYVWNERDLTYDEINSSDFSDQFWAKNTSIKNELIKKIKIYHENFKQYNLDKKYNDLLEIHELLIATLQNTIVSISIPESTLQSHIWKINTYQSDLNNQNEILVDVINQDNILKVAQKEKIENISTKISQKENELLLLWTKSQATQSDKTLLVTKLQAEIDTLQKSRDLLIANQNNSITTIKNEVSIAKAELNNQYIESWDYKIISPFGWTISKRTIEIWEKISKNTQAFRISWVDNTLSRITKKEVKFYIPENVKNSVKLWKEITFFSQNGQSKSFTWTIYRISPEVDEDNLSITVQAKVSEDILLPNKSSLRVQLNTQQEIYKIPSSTIYNKEDRKIIYYKKLNWKIWIRDITIISDDGEYSLITWKITDDLKIVTTPIFIK